MHPTEKYEREILLYMYTPHGMQSSQDRLFKVVKRKFRNATKHQVDKRLDWLEKKGYIKDLKRYKLRKVFILTDKLKEEFPREELILRKLKT